MADGRDIATLTSRYETFWQKIVALTGGKVGAKSNKNPFSVILSDSNDCVDVSTRRPLELMGAKSRPDARSRESYRVALDMQCTVRSGAERDYELERCTVRVLWLSTDAGRDVRPKALRGLHFDYEESKDHHPVFHAQVNEGVIESVDCERAPGPGMGTPRIPTAPMDLCGAIYMLLHDHYSSEVKQGWPENCRDVVGGLPRLPSTAFQEHVGDSLMDCVWWYPKHRR